MKDRALMYRIKYGYSVVPMGYFKSNGEDKGKKRPLIKSWKPYQTELPSIEQITEWWTEWPNAMIGVITGKLSGICTIDVDDEEGFKAMEDILPDSLLIPTYNTPSGGCQMVFKMPDFDLRLAVRNVPGCDLRAEGGIAIFPPSKNSSGEYKWLPELSIEENEIPCLPSGYINIISSNSNIYSNNKYNIYKEVVTTNDNIVTDVTSSDISFKSGSRNDSLFSVAYALAKGGMERNNVLYVVDNIAKNATPPLNDREIITIIDSAFSRHTGRTRNIHQELLAWIQVTTGNFHVTSSYNECQIVTKTEKAAARKAFSRFVSDGILERIGQKDGFYCLKQTFAEDIDFMNADTTPFDVKWPLDVHDLVEVYRKSIVIVAGETNAGKTAYCLNIAKKNRDKHNILYLLSEGDPAELKIRLSKFNEPLENWSNVKFRQIRGGKLSKLIDPNGFNIIDYLEMHKDFFEVSGVIDDIYQKLDKGIAVIAIQKPKGRDEAVGGRGTLDKARLYLSIEPNKIKIVKGKIWKYDTINPNNMFCTWNLGGGCYFKRTMEGWKKEEKKYY